MKSEMLKQIRKGEVYAIIPARAGSKGVVDKNIQCLDGYPMLAYSIAAAQQCPEISRIIVSTDSPRYAEIARYYGAETPFLRPEELAGDTSTDIDFMDHAITWLAEHEGSIPEFFVHLRPTYPLREISIMSDAIRAMQNDETATSLRSAHLASNTPYKWFNLREDGYFKSIRDDLTLDEANNPRQAFPDVFIPDGYVDVLRTSFLIENRLMHGNRMIGYVVPGGVDVDAAKDIEYLRYYLTNHACGLTEYLKQNYQTLEEVKL